MLKKVSLVVGPLMLLLLLLPTPEGLSDIGWRTAAVGLWMAVWWIGEPIPIYATSLLPLVVFAPLGIGSMEVAAAPYASPLVYLFMGGFMLALALEHSLLHKRAALWILSRIGTGPRRSIAGFIVCTALLSMWINNTATTMMMIPIGMSVIETVGKDMDKDERRQFGSALMLSIAYSASIGGVGTLIGTSPNLQLASYMKTNFAEGRLAFAQWMLMAVPVVLGLLPVLFWLLTRGALKVKAFAGNAQTQAEANEVISGQLRDLGPVRSAEIRVALIFGFVALVWVFRPLLSWIPGLSDEGVAVAGGLLLFLVPESGWSGRKLLEWDSLKEMPWGLLLLFGGGLSLAHAIKVTKLAEWIGGGLSGLAVLPTWLILLIIVAVIVFATEITSNTAITAAFLPVVGALSLSLGEDPRLFLIPMTMGASFAFMLPIATPPNAIIYSCPLVESRDMIRAGFWLNLICIVALVLMAYTLTILVFDITPGVLPDWAK